ncbi:MAG TPA: PH domain-containing protein [Gemmataceae bacterium]|nr:PH domain-containing protein [Gemmataceae bacterium]
MPDVPSPASPGVPELLRPVAVRKQAITGVVPPELGEARIREAWPSVARSPGMASLGRVLTRTIVLAPLAWLVMFFGYFGKVLPFLACRYTLTNRRLMIRRGLKGKPGQQVLLADIDEVRVKTDANSDFFRAADLDIISKGQVVLTLRGVPEPDGFRHAILNACNAWVPNRPRGPFLPANFGDKATK